MLIHNSFPQPDSSCITLRGSVTRKGGPASPPDRRLRQMLENAPWSTVVAYGGWAAVLLDMAVRNLHLCIRSAVLVDPAAWALVEGQRVALPLAPLAFPTAILTDNPMRTARHAATWGSHVHLRDTRFSEDWNLEAAFSGLNGPTDHLARTDHDAR